MATEREILGHINCPHCGLKAGMRISPDKSGAPFGYCEGDCSGQMRIGGNAARVAKFFALHAHLKRPAGSLVPPGTTPDILPASTAPALPAIPVTISAPPKPKAAPRKLSLFEQLSGVTA